MITLNDLPIGHSGKVFSLMSYGKERRRMLDLGFVFGTKVTVLFSSPFGDPKAYWVRGTIVAIRDEDASKIKIEV